MKPIVIIFVLLLISSCASISGQRRSMVDVVRDNVIISEFNSRKLKDDETKWMSIQPECWRGRLSLSGSVDNEELHRKILSFTSDLPNLVSLDDRIEVINKAPEEKIAEKPKVVKEVKKVVQTRSPKRNLVSKRPEPEIIEKTEFSLTDEELEKLRSTREQKVHTKREKLN